MNSGAFLAGDAVDILTRFTTLSYEGSKGDALPQGAPSSPQLSNLIMKEYDQEVARFCDVLGLKYSRYADDICISGGGNRDASIIRQNVIGAFIYARKSLFESYGMRVNQKKSAILPSYRQHRVTGVVVNEKALPPRKFRRIVRAMFDKFEKDPEIAADPQMRQKLLGYLSYFRQFEDYPQSELSRYEAVLSQSISTK